VRPARPARSPDATPDRRSARRVLRPRRQPQRVVRLARVGTAPAREPRRHRRAQQEDGLSSPRLLLLNPTELTRDPRARRQALAALARSWEVVGLCRPAPGEQPLEL